jgi:hypothetical protein
MPGMPYILVDDGAEKFVPADEVRGNKALYRRSDC